MNPCPTDSDLDFHFNNEPSELIANHVADCRDCRQKLEQKLHDEQLFNDLQKARLQFPIPFNENKSQAKVEAFASELRSKGYEIVAEISRGGQAVVFKATQIATSRFVAVKKLNLNNSSGAEQLLRFEREIDVISRLKHPNIVTIFDRGTAAGCPFFVMELVEGMTLSEYCSTTFPKTTTSDAVDPKRVRQLLELARKICSAINYAHRLGIIHRDLKPQNILIDDESNPRVLDFGLAKLTTNNPFALTEVGQFLGTLAYASPEQVKLAPEQIDIRTDVYSLGMILYEQLTGRLPYVVDEGLSERVNNILHSDPARPSELCKGIDRDLETILLKSLSKNPDRRYQSIQQFDRDIELYLNGQPIEARRDSKLYVFKKSVQRNKVFVTASATILLIILSALVVSLKFWKQAVGERDIARSAVASESKAKKDVEDKSNVVNIVAARGAVLAGDVAEAKRRLNNVSPAFRDWEWYYWKSRTAESLTTFTQHDLFIRDFEIFPDGDRVVSISGDHDIHVWSIANPANEFKIRTDRYAKHCRVNRAGTLIGISDDQSISIRDAENLSVVHQLQTGYRVKDFFFWPSEQKIVFCATHLKSGKEQIVQWEFGKNRVTAVPEQWTNLHVIAKNPRNNTIAVGCDDLRLYDMKTGAIQRTDLPGSFHFVCFHPSRELLAAANGWNVVVVDTRSMKIIAKLPTDHPVFSIDFGLKNDTLIVCGQGVHVWNFQTVKKVRSFLGHDQHVVKSRHLPVANKIITAAKDATFKIWDLKASVNPRMISHHGKPVRQIDFSPDQKWIASASEDGKVVIFDGSGNVKRELPHPGPVFAVRFSPDQKHLATAGNDRIIRIWDLRNWQVKTLHGHTDLIHSLNFDPTGQRLVSGSRDQSVRLWNIEDLSTIRAFDQHRECVHNATFDASGKWIASRCHFQVKVWNAESGQVIMSAKHRVGPEDYSLVFHPHKFELVAGTSILGYGKGFARIWDPKTGKVKSTLEKHYSPINALDYNPTATRIVTASNDAIKIWNVANSQEIVSLDRISSLVYCVRFSPDGSKIVAGLDSGNIMIWDAKKTFAANRNKQSPRNRH